MRGTIRGLALLVLSLLSLLGPSTLLLQAQSPEHRALLPAVAKGFVISPPTSGPPAEVAVDIRDFAFDPSEVRVRVGQAVRWTNRDAAGHTATARSREFDTSLLRQGQSGSVTFSRPGRFEYICTPHPFMVGTVVVE